MYKVAIYIARSWGWVIRRSKILEVIPTHSAVFSSFISRSTGTTFFIFYFLKTTSSSFMVNYDYNIICKLWTFNPLVSDGQVVPHNYHTHSSIMHKSWCSLIDSLTTHHSKPQNTAPTRLQPSKYPSTYLLPTHMQQIPKPKAESPLI